MPTYVHLVRHAQGFHNLSAANHQLPDPDLTPLGEEQCAQLCKNFPHHDKITHLVASPMRRTMHTCLLSFEPAAKAGKKVIALPELQEVSRLPCDTGSPTERLAAEFDAKADLGLVHLQPGWTDKGPNSPWSPEMNKLEARAKKARVYLRTLGSQVKDGDAHIIAVTHGGFLHFLTQDWDGMDPEKGRSHIHRPPKCSRPSARLTKPHSLPRHRMGQHRMQVVRVRRPQRAGSRSEPQGDER